MVPMVMLQSLLASKLSSFCLMFHRKIHDDDGLLAHYSLSIYDDEQNPHH
jgi:hypothetical protein